MPPNPRAAFKAFALARAAGLPIVFDVDYRPYSWPSAQVAEDVLSRADAPADVIVGIDGGFGVMAGGLEKGREKARDLAAATAALAIYKMGEKGAVTFYRGEEIRTGIYSVPAM